MRNFRMKFWIVMFLVGFLGFVILVNYLKFEEMDPTRYQDSIDSVQPGPRPDPVVGVAHQYAITTHLTNHLVQTSQGTRPPDQN